MDRGTHGGQDVGVWASGPQSHLFSGNYEQNVIPLLMAHVLQVGPYAVDEKSEGNLEKSGFYLIFISVVITIVY